MLRDHIFQQIVRFFALIIYYALARYLPNLPKFPIGSFIRTILCKNIFKKSAQKFNVERKAVFGTGMGIEIGENSNIGLRAILGNTKEKGGTHNWK